MNRKTLGTILAAVLLIGLVACNSSKYTPPPPQETIAATKGTPQSATISTAFNAPLVATVTTGTTADSGVSVTFTAPGNGASGTFAGGGATATVMTDANGNATSPAFTANGTAGSYTVSATASGATGTANFSLSNTAGTPASIAVVSGNSQSAPVNTAFTNPLVVVVEDSGSNPVNGVVVTFTPPAAGASATFAGGVNTATTGANGQASIAATANGTVGGPYTVAASVNGVANPANFSLTNTQSTAATQNFSFYAAGTDASDFNYTIAGSILLSSTGSVMSGEQDFNDGSGNTSPEPSGDSITGGSLVVNAAGQGTLTVTTNNASWPTETFAVDFANGSHALITEFDGVGTSTGSLDLQTLTAAAAAASPQACTRSCGLGTSQAVAAPTGTFAFAVAGLDPSFNQIVAGGIFNINGNSLTGTIDVNDAGAEGPVFGTAFTGTANAPDSFGRGSITQSSLGITFVYYIVGTEALRIIDVDTTDIILGSAFGQGDFAGGYGASSIGQSVISFTGTPIFVPLVFAGQINTTPTSSTFSGVADVNEYGSLSSASAISGTYTMGGNGYGSLSITNGGAQNVTTFGIYAVDPNLNINDPNNVNGGGGALVADMDADADLGGSLYAITGIGVLVPQTDTTPTDFAGPYAFDGQFVTTNDEADFVGFGTVTGTSFSGSGGLNDPFGDFVSTAINSGVTFAGTLSPDAGNPGRFNVFTLNMTVPGNAAVPLDVAIYQASAGQLFWVEEDSTSAMSGQLQQQPPTPTFPAVKKGGTKTASAQAAAATTASPKPNK
jgi:hypothetical protein